jgi:hypothetical protein
MILEKAVSHREYGEKIIGCSSKVTPRLGDTLKSAQYTILSVTSVA